MLVTEEENKNANKTRQVVKRFDSKRIYHFNKTENFKRKKASTTVAYSSEEEEYFCLVSCTWEVVFKFDVK